MATRPKGYRPKGGVKSIDAVRKAKARKELTSLKGIGGIVGNAILNSPAGRVGKAGKVSSKVMLAVRREMRKKSAGVGQRAKVTTGQARLVTSEASKAPVKRTRDVVSKDSGRGLSAREKQQVTARDTITRPKPNKPKSRVELAIKKQEASDRAIRNALTIKVNPARPKTTPKRDTPRVSSKPKRSAEEIRNTLKNKKVRIETRAQIVNGKIVDKPVRMDAQEYFDTRLAQKLAAKDPENMLRPTTRKMKAEKEITANRKRITAERREGRRERKVLRRDTRAAQANPQRYSSPKQEPGNRIMTERLVDIGLENIKKAEASKAAQRAKIAATPRVKKKVDATLDEAAKARAAAAKRNRVDSRKITVRKKRGE